MRARHRTGVHHYVAACVLLAVVGLVVNLAVTAAPGRPLPWERLAALLCATVLGESMHLAVLRRGLRGDCNVFLLGEVSVALATVSPSQLTLPVLVCGYLLSHVVVARRKPGHATFNIACSTLGAAAALLLAGAVGGLLDAPPLVKAATMAVVAALTSNVVTLVVVSGVIARSEGCPTWQILRSSWGTALATGMLGGACGVVLVSAAVVRPASVWVLLLFFWGIMALVNSRTRERIHGQRLELLIAHLGRIHALMDPDELPAAIRAAADALTNPVVTDVRPEPPAAGEVGTRLRSVSGLPSFLVIRPGMTRHLYAPDQQILDLLAGAAGVAVDNATTHRRISDAATRDTLTGLVNHGQFLELMEQQLGTTQADGGRFGVVFIDLDGFKAVNDTYGHHLGDDLLRVVASRLTVAARDGDVVGRVGGDEFCVLVHELAGPGALDSVLQRLREAFELPVTLQGCVLQVTPSLGAACFPDDAQSVGDMLRVADAGMYAAKVRRRPLPDPRQCDHDTLAKGPAVGAVPRHRQPTPGRPRVAATHGDEQALGAHQASSEQALGR